MEKHFELTDSEFEQQFIACKLDPSIFSHEAHLRLAWINIKKYGIQKAEKNVQVQLENFVKYHGANDKYNKTLTIAAVKIVNHFVKQFNANSFFDFILKFNRLKTDFKGLITSHYSLDIFNSKKAKTDYVEPDLLPFE